MKIYKSKNLKRKCTIRLDDEENGFLSWDGKVYRINSVSYEIIKMLDEKKCNTEIVSCLCKKYAVPSEQIATDVENFTSQLKKAQLIGD